MTLDRFQVHMQYRSMAKDTAQSWYFNNLDDSRLNVIPSNTTTVDTNNPNKIISGGGSITDGGETVTTFEVLTTSGYDETKVIHNHNLAKSQKFAMLPTDWTNIEVTFYADFLIMNPNSRLEIFGRSGRHVNGRPCEGTKYSMHITSDGHFVTNIKRFHSGGTQFLQDEGVLGDVEGQRVGIKFIMYNNTYDSNPTAVNLECYVDRFGDNVWEMVCQFSDIGYLTAPTLPCGTLDTAMITWGAPIAGLKLINIPIGGITIEKFSIREIDALAPKFDLLPEPVVVDPEAVSAPTAPPSTGYRTDLDDDDWDVDLTYPPPAWGDPGDP